MQSSFERLLKNHTATFFAVVSPKGWKTTVNSNGQVKRFFKKHIFSLASLEANKVASKKAEKGLVPLKSLKNACELRNYNYVGFTTVVDHKTDLSSGELRNKRILPLF